MILWRSTPDSERAHILEVVHQGEGELLFTITNTGGPDFSVGLDAADVDELVEFIQQGKVGTQPRRAG